MYKYGGHIGITTMGHVSQMWCFPFHKFTEKSPQAFSTHPSLHPSKFYFLVFNMERKLVPDSTTKYFLLPLFFPFFHLSQDVVNMDGNRQCVFACLVRSTQASVKSLLEAPTAYCFQNFKKKIRLRSEYCISCWKSNSIIWWESFRVV